ncbi:MAG: antibiotic biosynthesis monooxygenase [Actinomycetota bacterium]|nr:antibiotic biosynthesis monooxygenase [Actinomycetota bacterium]
MSTDPQHRPEPSPVFARTPEPPYYAVIFTTTQTDDGEGYGDTAAAMEALALQQPGYLGIESARSGGLGITVSYWTDEVAISAWRQNVLHAAAREQGRAQWYAHYELRVAKVERASNWDRPASAEHPHQ